MTGDRDPAAVAADTPETGGDERVDAVGVGPGNPEYLVPRARRAIREADVVVGFETVVDVVRGEVDTDARWLTCGYDDESETLSAFADRVSAGAAGVAVLMGDPNHSGYQFVGKVASAVEGRVRVVPGISSLQVAASRARTPMEATTFVTLHKRGSLAGDLARLRADVGDRHLLILPRPYDWMPGDVAAHLLDAGAVPTTTALVMERLTHDNETITRSTLEELATHEGGSGREETPFSDLSVLAVRSGRG
ncbi:cobalt-precorrin-7 (C(5))-methyltransferase [Haloplanus sp.]|uniref:cobalt-precorrin-7 (C(5))-methyltransferase n=1 Tax=Haloplanus sp. TaxID=1961696 RepID=UPI002609A5A4|nr:cobalt-precorrin-7 (C(5))-methyltransferase [Haloplanus sp.]